MLARLSPLRSGSPLTRASLPGMSPTPTPPVHCQNPRRLIRVPTLRPSPNLEGLGCRDDFFEAHLCGSYVHCDLLVRLHACSPPRLAATQLARSSVLNRLIAPTGLSPALRRALRAHRDSKTDPISAPPSPTPAATRCGWPSLGSPPRKTSPSSSPATRPATRPATTPSSPSSPTISRTSGNRLASDRTSKANPLLLGERIFGQHREPWKSYPLDSVSGGRRAVSLQQSGVDMKAVAIGWRHRLPCRVARFLHRIVLCLIWEFRQPRCQNQPPRSSNQQQGGVQVA